MTTKEKILLTALALFAKQGYEAVSVRDLAEGLHLSPAALYKHYQNKQAIFDAIVTRMAQQDFERAKAFAVPELPAGQNPAAYTQTTFAQLQNYTLAQFEYWTQDPLASAFRKMLQLERYRNLAMAELYQNYLGEGVLRYLTDIFAALNPELTAADAQLKALKFFAPVFMLIDLYDTGNERKNLQKQLQQHLKTFAY